MSEDSWRQSHKPTIIASLINYSTNTLNLYCTSSFQLEISQVGRGSIEDVNNELEEEENSAQACQVGQLGHSSPG